MERFAGILLVLVGLVIGGASGTLAGTVAKSNQAATGAFGGKGWKAWNRLIFIGVGIALAITGLALIVGLARFEET